MRNPGEMYCWNDQGHRVCDQDLRPKYVPLRVLKFLQGIIEGPLCWEDKKMHPYGTLMHTCQDGQPRKYSKRNLDNN